MIESLSEYLVSEVVLNSRLRRLTDNAMSLNSLALKEDTEGSLLGHPLDVYLLIRRMAIDWKEVKDLLRTKDQRLSDVQMRQIGGHSNHTNAVNVTFGAKLVSSSQQIITNKELNDAAIGVINLVNTYDLDIKSLANGFIRSKSSSGAEVTSHENQSKLALNTFDCYLIGKQSFDNKEYLNAKQWLKEAVHRLDDMTSDEIIADIFNYLSFFEQKIGKPSEAQKYKRLSVAIKPDIETNELISESKERSVNDTNGIFGVKDKPIFGLSANVYQLCRGERLMNDSIVSKLMCFYLNTTKTPILTRIKVEEMYKSPQIVVIHDFLSEYETQTIISLAQPSVFWDRQHKPLQTISRRIGAITGLNMNFADEYNVIKYSVGGYADDHYDGYRITLNISWPVWQRMATWINYLSDVGAGGATVFPLINVTVWPTKYSAVFWYTLDKSGELNGQTLHGGCPVLVGRKWIAGKWFPWMGQEFRKPCDPYDRQSRHYIQ
ncbi:unnamed protein product [Oppiella nova]|uniref:procollagen-proline 4-dioxygenase n=1 Tax=Oppiella nova TaxID=334625 RepID=A0A7R9QQA8_9ACAR|nr:unnamed protein product [Oppiella nova]CAG2171637.1 unnamed protein product [Oppiella nova]